MLTPVPLKAGDPPLVLLPTVPSRTLTVLVMDTETTGFKAGKDEIVELGGVEVVVDLDLRKVYSIEPAFNFLREPGVPIAPQASAVHKLYAADLKGKRVNLDVVYRYINRAQLLVCHNSRFDVPFLEEFLEELKFERKKWACTCYDPNWPAIKPLGDLPKFSVRKLGKLLEESGYSLDAHRAINDCIGTAWLLHLYPEALNSVLEMGRSDTFVVEVYNAPWKMKPSLDSAGFAFTKRDKTNINFRTFADYDDMVEARANILSYFDRFGKPSDAGVAVVGADPFTRFSKKE